jgi:hypothetical protein
VIKNPSQEKCAPDGTITTDSSLCYSKNFAPTNNSNEGMCLPKLREGQEH